MKVSINKLPKSAMALYIRIYCQKHDKTRNKQYNLIEATKSWVSLSKTDKEYFLNVFKEYETKVKNYFAINLQNAQVYMKKKKSDRKSLSKSKTTIDCNQPTYEDMRVNKENSYSSCYNDNKHNVMEIQHDNEQLEHYNPTIPLQSVKCESAEPVPKLIPEPIPPLRSSIELFEIIKHNEESTKNVNWGDLTKLQKQRYHRALLRIKNDYIKQYTAYLEQFTSIQLFHYYKSKF